MRLLPSLLNANWADFGKSAQSVLDQGAHGLHIDVMDNHFVPNLSFGPTLCEDLRRYGIQAYLDVHLMVKPVNELIIAFAKAGVNRISFHPEASEDVSQSISLIKSFDVESGLALSPNTAIAHLEPVLDSLDHVLIMSVEPGFGGQRFMDASLEKAHEVKSIVGPAVSIGIDGGINQDNISQIKNTGVISDVVVGSAIFKSSNIPNAMRDLISSLK